MTNRELAAREVRATNEAFVIAQIGDAFSIYAPADPKTVYQVTGPPQAPQCTCPDFRFHRNDPDWHCKHILAVLKEFSDIEVVGQGANPIDTGERRAMQEESRAPRRRKAIAAANGNGSPAQMVLKRSVSPDGRIDSLSVEFSCGVGELSAPEIELRAKQTLALQSIIAEAFVAKRRTAELLEQPHAPEEKSPAVPARLVNVAGMQTKWGRRLFINVQVNGQTLKLFGKKDELAQVVTAAGFPGRNIAEGVALDLACRVTTKPSDDGRFTNVDQVFPPDTGAPQRR